MITEIVSTRWTCDGCKKEIIHTRKYSWNDALPEGWTIVIMKTPFYKPHTYQHYCPGCSAR